MKFVLIAAALIGWWAWRTRAGRALRIGDVAAVVAALVGLRLGMKGQIPFAAAALGGAGWWVWFRRHAPIAPAPAAMPLDEARRLLGVSGAADRDDIRAAHRRLLLRVHPDVGGSVELAGRLNAARDALIDAIEMNPKRFRA